MEYLVLIHIVTALGLGLLIGIERGWSERKEEEGQRVAGIRTFGLIGLLGGVWAKISQILTPWMLGAAFLAVAGIVIASHMISSRQTKDMGITTEFAMLVTFSLGAWAALGQPLFALGAAVIVMGLLGTKPLLHAWLRKIETKEIYAAIKLLIISVVLLPYLPNQGYGPWEALNPYWIWWMVVLISGISFVGYFLIKYFGESSGTLLAAVMGGLASSTALAVSMAGFASKQSNKRLFMGATMVASSIMFVRVLIEVAVVNVQLLPFLWLPMAAMFFAVGIGGLVFSLSGQPVKKGSEIELKNPFNLSTALKFGAALAVILVLTQGAKNQFGDTGIYVLSAVSGLIDVDAITLSLSKMAKDDLSPSSAALGILLAASVNTLIKAVLFAFFAGFRESYQLVIWMGLAIVPGLVLGGWIFWTGTPI